jgi:hypothetical protein
MDKSNLNWDAIIADWRASNLRISAYCKQHDIKVSHFHYYRRRIEPLTPKSESVFMPLQINNASLSYLEYVHPDGHRFTFHQPVNAEFIKSLVK